MGVLVSYVKIKAIRHGMGLLLKSANKQEATGDTKDLGEILVIVSHFLRQNIGS